MLKDSFKLNNEQVLLHYQTDPLNGLTSEQVLKNKSEYGFNGMKGVLIYCVFAYVFLNRIAEG
jgi:uncharacterized protein (DUF2132 family)